MNVRWSVMVLLVAAFAVVPHASAQVNSCGEGFELFMRNPDLVPQGDGKFHVSGDFFVQFQVIGAQADQIETFAFSVGVPPELPEEICSLPVWPTGLMLEAYKVDTDKEDGFFILMNTKGQTTPQNTDLTVAVHGYDASGTELARFWGVAVVESCPDTTGGCPESQAQDTMQPWPVILPGDGAKSYVDGFSLEFAEELSSLLVLLNGVDVTAELQPWEGRLWDADTYYDYGPAGVVGQATPMCTLPAPFHNCVQSPGPSYQWTQRSITGDDVIRVEATDAAGNVAIKEIHVGSSVAGGTISDDAPILTMTFSQTQQIVNPGALALFIAEIQNTGGGTGHPFTDQTTAPPGWDVSWSPSHQPVAPASKNQYEVSVVVPANTTTGEYVINAVMEYRQGTEDRRLETPLTVFVQTGGVSAEDEEDEPAAGGAKESPYLPLVAMIGVLVAWAFVRRT